MKAFDLNLLRVLVALGRTRHVGRAADALEMSQSGFSTALARLRQQVGDVLFLRTAGGMQPTPRALALIATAHSVLQQVEQQVFVHEVFDPLQAAVAFRLSMSDVAEVVFMPSLIRHMAEHAPLASVHVSLPGSAPLHERLSSGETDLAIGYFPDLERDAYFRQPLLSHTYACVVRCGHPVLAKGMRRSDYESLGHAVVSIPARSNVLLADAITRQRIQRKVVLSSPNHLSLAATIAQTDLVATVPLGTAVDFARSSLLEVVALPFRPPSFTIYQYWHKRTQNEPSYQWLRALLMTLFNARSDPYAAQRQALYGRRATRE